MVKISVKNVARLAATAGLGMSLAFSVAPAVALANEPVPVTETTPAEGAENTATPAEVDTAQELKDAVANNSVTTIKLTADIELSETLVVSRAVTIDGGGFSITGGASFAQKQNLISLQSYEGDVVLNNITLVAGANNKHVLNVWCGGTLALNGVTLNHSAAMDGAPLVINHTEVTVTGKLDITTGANSWYAVNVDSKYGDASFTVSTEAGGSLETSGPKPGVVAENTNPDATGDDKKMPTVDLGYPEGQTVEVKNEQTGQTSYQRAVAHIGTDNYASVEDALKNAKSGDIITLYQDIDTPIDINKEGVTLDADNHSITSSTNATNYAVRVIANNVTVKNASIKASQEKSHGVYFYKATGGVLENCTVEGGTYTSVLVNGSTVTIKDCKLNPASGAYANVEYGMGDGVKTIPGITFEGTLELGNAEHGIWADKATTERIKNELGTNATDQDVQKKLTEGVTNNTKTDVKIDAVLPGGGDASVEVPGEKPVTPPVETGHAVTVEQVEGGKVAVTPEKADKGETVTITATPDAGQEVRSVEVIDAAGRAVAVKAGSKANTWTFAMPDGAVKVAVTFGCDGGELCPSHEAGDVDAGSWYHDVMDWAVEEGLITGFDDGTLGPEATLSRGQLATVLYRRAGEPATDAELTFDDCDPEAFYAKAVAWAAEEGVIMGYGDGSAFGPDDPVTREQLATILWRLAGEPESSADLDAYPDAADATAYAVEALEWATENDVLMGFGSGELAPTGQLNRAMLAAMLMRLDA